jgi:hypothetical protein
VCDNRNRIYDVPPSKEDQFLVGQSELFRGGDLLGVLQDQREMVLHLLAINYEVGRVGGQFASARVDTSSHLLHERLVRCVRVHLGDRGIVSDNPLLRDVLACNVEQFLHFCSCGSVLAQMVERQELLIIFRKCLHHHVILIECAKRAARLDEQL